MRQTFHYLRVLIKGMAQKWLLETQRTAEDLPGVLNITTVDNCVSTLATGYIQL